MQGDTSALTLGTGYGCRIEGDGCLPRWYSLSPPNLSTQQVDTCLRLCWWPTLIYLLPFRAYLKLVAEYRLADEQFGSVLSWRWVCQPAPKIQTDLQPAKLYLCCCTFLHFLLHLPHCTTQIKTCCSTGKRVFYKTGWHGCGLSKLISVLDGSHEQKISLLWMFLNGTGWVMANIAMEMRPKWRI